MNNGVILVASMSKAYYDSAVRCAISISDYAPGTKVTLFTHKTFLQSKYEKFFDEIVTDIPVNIRSKMWALNQTKYDNTLYLDADMEVMSEEFCSVFNYMEDKDLMFTKIRSHVSKEVFIDLKKTKKLSLHGGFFIYRKNNRTIDLMKDWYYEYNKQRQINFKQVYPEYDFNMRKWDQFTLWRLLNEKYNDLKIGIMPEDYRWNWIWLYDYKGTGEPNSKSAIIYHHTIPEDLVNATNLKYKFGITTDFD